MTAPILVSLGDPHGCGPEIVARALARPSIRRLGVAVVGNPKTFERSLRLAGLSRRLVSWTPGQPIPAPGSSRLALLETVSGTCGEDGFYPGVPTAGSGAESLAALDAAADAVAQGHGRALVTAPLSKEAVDRVHPGFRGHTGHLAHRFGNPPHCLCLVLDHLWAAFVTTHVPLAQVPQLVTRPLVAATGRLLGDALRRMGLSAPRLGVAGLNPHAGEGGLMGQEDLLEVAPAIVDLVAEGWDARGPVPADVVFPQLMGGLLDGVVSLYHDQGHPVIKSLAIDLRRGITRGVNATLGLPIVRTSPDHGTAFDRAWRLPTHEGSLVEALWLADRLAHQRAVSGS